MLSFLFGFLKLCYREKHLYIKGTALGIEGNPGELV